MQRRAYAADPNNAKHREIAQVRRRCALSSKRHHRIFSHVNAVCLV
jgi:hypothetical protein